VTKGGNEEDKDMEKKKFLILVLAVGLVGVLMASPCSAKEILVFDRPLNILGYMSQEAGFSLSDKDRYDTEKGLQTTLTNLFVEVDYKISDQLKFYGSSRITGDWIYQLKHNDSSWHDKQFNQSKGNLNIDDKYWQILREANFTWTPGKFFFRVGKQIVTWGELLGLRVMDQINPLDSRRALGLNDIEFDYTPIPIWLIRSEFHPGISTKWVQDLAFEFVFNPNADDINDLGVPLGNDEAGIWAPNIRFPDPTYPPGGRIGSAISDIKTPGHFNRKGYEYAFRVKGVIWDTMVTLNAFYGRENSPIQKYVDPFVIPDPQLATDDRYILHPVFEGYYPRFRFFGATASRDIPFLKAAFLGNVAPVFRVEGFYAYHNTFTDALSAPFTNNKIKQFDEYRAAISIDWKVKIRLLNARANFFINPQVYYRRINLKNSPSEIASAGGTPDWYDTANTRVGKNNWTTTLYIDTVYFNARLRPSIFWIHDWEFGGDYFLPQVMFDLSHNWRFTLGALIWAGKKLPGAENGTFKANNGFDVFKHKDQIFFRVTYRWS
jgi:hypothetical protein